VPSRSKDTSYQTRADDLKDKTNAKTNQFSAAARKPVSEYQLARLGSPGPSRSHIGRRGVPDRISAVACRRNRMARGKPRRTDDPHPLRSAAEAQAHPPPVSRREGGAHAGVRPALVANRRRFIARYRAPAVSLQPIGSYGGVRGISSRVGKRSRLRTHDHPKPEWRLIRLTGAIALGMTKDAVHFVSR
jgi:hypothetical protein